MSPDRVSQGKNALSRRRFLYAAGGALGAVLAGCRPPTPEPAPQLPDYVDDGRGVPVFRGPYLQSDARMAAFLLSADVAVLQSWCETLLNVPSDHAVDYVPFGPYALLVYADMQIQSLDSRDQKIGWMAETEVGVWVPLVRRKDVGGIKSPDHAAWLLPYLFVDNPYAIAAGREVYGFNKTWGQFEHPADIRRPEFALDVWGFDTFGLQVEGKPQRLLEVRALAPNAEGNVPGEWTGWDAARSTLIQYLFADWNPEETGTDAPWVDHLEHMPLVFLKQFRDAEDSSKACYQAVVEAPLRIETFYGGGMLSDAYGLTLPPLASHPLADALGLQVDADGVARALAAFWLHGDFVLESGMVLWQAGA
ncbi:MAG: twin-arginine translocation signal domain-containing protein [Anaerolineae bacterium]|nr:twin-arginine translocation signal domain-containing protein [Anaerolineae bacterium]